MGDVIRLKLPGTKHRLRIDADYRGHFVQIFPPPSIPKPTWRFADYEAARFRADELSQELGLKVHDAINPPFMEQFR